MYTQPLQSIAKDKMYVVFCEPLQEGKSSVVDKERLIAVKYESLSQKPWAKMATAALLQHVSIKVQ